MKKENSIPKGIYCYDENGVCPFWSIRKDQDKQNNGYCSYLKCGDWENRLTSLLWDQVKECGINDDMEEWDV
jgi:hypothetical protein